MNSKQMDFEQINHTIYRMGDLHVSLLILPNRKQNSSGNLLTGSYINQYNSRKYNDRSHLSSLSINFNTYISFEYLTFFDNNRISENVLVSYPHIDDLYDFLVNASNLLTQNFEEIYTKEGISQEYSEFLVSEALVSGKQLGVMPSYVSVQVEDIVTEEPGVLFLIKDENYITEMSLTAFLGLAKDVSAICNSYSLRSLANQVYQMAQLDYIIHKMGGSLLGSSGGGQSPVFNKAPKVGGRGNQTSGTGFQRRGLGGNIPRRSSSGGLGSINRGAGNRVVGEGDKPKMPKPTINRKAPQVEDTSLDELEKEQNEELEVNDNIDTGDLNSEIMKQASEEEFDIGDDDIDFPGL